MIEKLFEIRYSTSVITIFRKTIFGYTLMLTLYLAVNASSFWGANSLIAEFPHPSGWWFGVFNLLVGDDGSRHVVFLFLLGLSSIMGFLGVNRQLAAALAFFSGANLFNGAFLAVNGGNQLLVLLLFLLIFVHEHKKPPLQIMLNNVFWFGVKWQIVMMYLIPAVYKLGGESWLNGSATFYVFQIEEYSNAVFGNMAESNWLVKGTTYGTLAYQLLFPVLVWMKLMKPYLLLLGVLMHLGIAFGMGLPDFGLLMIACYTAFIEPQHVGFLKQKLGIGWLQSRINLQKVDNHSS